MANKFLKSIKDKNAEKRGERTDNPQANRLMSFIERVERLEEEKSAIASDIKEVYAEAKGEGWDVKILKMVVRIRKMDRADYQEQEALLDLYLTTLGER